MEAPSRCPVMRTYRFILVMLTFVTTSAFAPAQHLSRFASRGWPSCGRPTAARLVAAGGCAPRWPPPPSAAAVPVCASLAEMHSALGPRQFLRLCNGGGKGAGAARKRKRARRASAPLLSAVEAEGGDDKPVLVLGAGWVGSRLAESLLEYGRRVLVTHRPGFDAQAKPPYFRPVPLDLPAETVLAFDINDRSTWNALPPPEELGAVVITFSLGTADGPQPFWEAYLGRVPNVICYSTTSVYQVDTPGQLVDEHTPIRSTPRATAEAYCLDQGATLLT